jgi:hypothetical protein
MKNPAVAQAERINEHLGWQGAHAEYDSQRAPDGNLRGYTGRVVLSARAAEELKLPRPDTMSA